MPLRCVDASFVVAWLVPSQGSKVVQDAWFPYAAGLDEFIAPPFLYAETITAIRRLASENVIRASSPTLSLISAMYASNSMVAQISPALCTWLLLGAAPDMGWVSSNRTAT